MSTRNDCEKRFHEGLCLAAGLKDEPAGAAFLECVISQPGNGEYVSAFLSNLRRRFPEPPASASSNAEDLAAPLLQAASRHDWAEVLQAGPRRLAVNPWNVPCLLTMAGACADRGFSESQVHYWKAAVEAAPADLEVQRRAGEAFARLQHFEEALGCWQRVEGAHPDDEQAQRRIVEVTIAKSRQRGGLERPPASARRQKVRHVFAPPDVSFSLRGSSLSPIQQLEAELRERPSVGELYLQLAQIYLDKDREYDADRLLAKGRESTDRDPRVQAMWEDVTMQRHAKRVVGAEEDVQAAADAPSKEKAETALAQAIRDRDRAELEVFRGRCQRKPEDAGNQYELGVRLKRMEKLPEAREHLEKSLADPHQRCAAALELGRLHHHSGDLAKALHYYRSASGESTSAEDLEMNEQARASAAKLAESIKLARLAKRYSGSGQLSVGSGTTPTTAN